MKTIYQRSYHIFADDNGACRELKRFRRRTWASRMQRETRILSAVIVTVLLTVFVLGLFLGNVLFSSAHGTEDPVSYKYYRSETLHCGETLSDLASAFIDTDHYDSMDAYLAEVCLINHITDPEDINAGTYVILPYYSAEFR